MGAAWGSTGVGREGEVGGEELGFSGKEQERQGKQAQGWLVWIISGGSGV